MPLGLHAHASICCALHYVWPCEWVLLWRRQSLTASQHRTLVLPVATELGVQTELQAFFGLVLCELNLANQGRCTSSCCSKQEWSQVTYFNSKGIFLLTTLAWSTTNYCPQLVPWRSKVEIIMVLLLIS